MGHIPAHSKIIGHVIEQLRPIEPKANLIYLELGNFITDISQFRDPYAFISAKQRLPLVARILRVAISDTRYWADHLFGKAPDKRFAALAQFFEHVSRFATQLFFAEDSKFSQYFVKTLQVSALNPAEVNRVFNWAFTQYYPHEHFDFPPLAEGPKHRNHLRFRRGVPKNLIGYLEEQLQFIAEELSKIELEWVKQRSLPSKGNIDDVLVRLGHIQHAVEDFYFHSNFVELWQWQLLQRLDPKPKAYQTPQESQDYKNLLLSNALKGTAYDQHSILLRRRFARRLQYPVFVRGTEGDPAQSEDARGLLYTGGFGGTDVFHTVIGALEAMEEFLPMMEMAGVAEVIELRESDLVLVKLMFNESERKKLADRDFTLQKQKEHRKQVMNNEYRDRIARKREQKIFNPEAATALQKAFEVDKGFMSGHPSGPGTLGQTLPGVGEFLILFMAEAQREAEHSDKQVSELNKESASIYQQGTLNGASEETIGTHSLMAKDGDKKQPMRDEAVALAKFASAAVAVLIARRVQKDKNPEHGLDWQALIQHVTRFPPDGPIDPKVPRSWEADVIAAVRANGKLLTLDMVKDKFTPEKHMLGSGSADGKLQKLRQGTMTKKLEKLYEQLETNIG